MAYVITDACTSAKDTACVAICPVDCIHPRPESPEFPAAAQLYIDPDVCMDCGLCVDECPVRAIFAEDDLPTELQRFVQINADYFKRR